MATAQLPEGLSDGVARLVESMSPDQVILFGSHAKGTARPDSDVDLVVVLPDQAFEKETRLALFSKAMIAFRPCPWAKDILIAKASEFASRKTSTVEVLGLAYREGVVLHRAQ